MSWTATASYEPAFSPRKRFGVVLLIVAIVLMQCLFEYIENGALKLFQLFVGLSITSTLLEWKNFRKSRKVHLTLGNGRLMYTNLYTNEKQTVYQSRTEWIKQEGDDLIFYSANSIATLIPLHYFSPDDQRILLEHIKLWNKKVV
jgi:hypothetical protein